MAFEPHPQAVPSAAHRAHQPRQKHRQRNWAFPGVYLIVNLIALAAGICCLLIQGSWAQEGSRASSACDDLSTVQGVMNCALEEHPELKRDEIGIQQARVGESRARQIPNPEIESKSTFGSSLGDDQRTVEADLAFTLQLGGKRSARIERSRAEQALAQAGLFRTKQEVFLSTLLALTRLRQLRVELDVYDEALRTFAKIQRFYATRPRLQPEQQVSLGVFQLAEGDYQFRKNSTLTEQARVLNQIKFSLGRDFTATQSNLPLPKSQWPTLSPPANRSTAPVIGGPILQLGQAELKLAQADLSLAQSDSWPDLRIGPSLEQQVSGPISYTSFGFNVSLPLPLFNLNGGGRAYATQGVLRAEAALSATQKQIQTEQLTLTSQYENAVAALSRAPSLKEIERKHKNAEALFERGVVSSSLIIEAHRQIVDFTRSQNEQELLALEAFWKVRAVEGRMFEEKL